MFYLTVAISISKIIKTRVTGISAVAAVAAIVSLALVKSFKNQTVASAVAVSLRVVATATAATYSMI